MTSKKSNREKEMERQSISIICKDNPQISMLAQLVYRDQLTNIYVQIILWVNNSAMGS